MTVWVRTGTSGAGTIYYAFADHLGSIVGLSYTGGTFLGSSLARYEPFGGYRTKPASSANPDIADRGFI